MPVRATDMPFLMVLGVVFDEPGKGQNQFRRLSGKERNSANSQTYFESRKNDLHARENRSGATAKGKKSNLIENNLERALYLTVRF
jgi:GrpB-like predicted nucleotidyltransferase (UPF0157 family)